MQEKVEKKWPKDIVKISENSVKKKKNLKIDERKNNADRKEYVVNTFKINYASDVRNSRPTFSLYINQSIYSLNRLKIVSKFRF